MKSQFLITFVSSVFLIACTTTPKANTYSYTETGRWTASSKEKAHAKIDAIAFLVDRVISSCEAIGEILQTIEETPHAQAEIQVSAEELKQAMLKTDAQGNIFLKNPDCKDKIFTLAEIVCENSDDGDQFCEAVRLRRQVDRTILQLQTADSANFERTVAQLTNEIEQLEQLYSSYDQQIEDDELNRKLGMTSFGITTGSSVALGMLASKGVFTLGSSFPLLPTVFATAAAGATGLASGIAALLTISLLMEGGIILYSTIKALNQCKNTNIRRCRRDSFARTHSKIWSGIVQIPASVVAGIMGVASIFRQRD